MLKELHWIKLRDDHIQYLHDILEARYVRQQLSLFLFCSGMSFMVRSAGRGKPPIIAKTLSQSQHRR